MKRLFDRLLSYIIRFLEAIRRKLYTEEEREDRLIKEIFGKKSPKITEKSKL